jgi:hypothetical protein
MATHDAPRGQHNINRASHGDSELSQLQVVLGSWDDDIFSAEWHKVEPTEKSPNLIELFLHLASLQDLDEVQVANRQLLRVQQTL